MTRSLALALLLSLPAAAAEQGFNGDWSTTYGPMTLAESSGAARGTYISEGQVCTLEGKVKDGVFEFSYKEPDGGGTGRFTLSPGGLGFGGTLVADGTTAALPWNGTRLWKPQAGGGFEGLWETTFGRLRLIREGAGWSGWYSYAGGSLEGREEDGVLKFRYEDVKKGEGEFRLGRGGRSFTGRWRAAGDEKWSDWNGLRADPSPNRRWLVVLESRWESSLDADEYTYGEMLKSFFSRDSRVVVRQRFYTDRASLAKWVREASLLAEPVVLYFSGHGGPDGLVTEDGPAGVATLAGPMAGGDYALVHFGSCDVMKGPVPAALQKVVPGRPFPVSGFAQPVDWAASAVTDFMYLDLILSRGLPPEKAAAELVRLMPFAARKSAATSYDGVSFRFLPARKAP
ncbi:MAG: hypothetical protein M0D55_17320 [Elusimicrobiota bacterium]|nr:MAG: hypothetical protein M0D55_17320 [Elusimicrobiota bacterium]